MKFIFSLVAGVFALTFISNAANPLPANRTPGGRGSWNGLVGVPGGIPTNRAVYITIPAGASAATIQSALNSCPSNRVVQLSAGTYTLTSRLNIGTGVTLRGAGMNSTTLDSSSAGNCAIMIGNDNWYNEWVSPNASLHRNITAGCTQGSTVITVSDVSGLTVGKLILMDQINDVDTTAYSPANPDGPYVVLEYTSVAHPNMGYDRVQSQLNRVVAISGNNVTLSEPIYMPNWNLANNPQIWWFNNYGQPFSFSGVEDLKIITSHNDEEGIDFRYTYGCWARNVWVSGGGAHDAYFFTLLGLRTEISHCLLYPEGRQSIDDYGIRTLASSGCLIENNIGNGCGTLMMVNGVSGSVYAYNYATNLQSQGGFMTAGLFTHGGTPNMNLFEGNLVPMFGMNSQWQNASYNVAHRNRFTGLADGNFSVTGNIEAVEINATNRHMSMIGNVLGTTGVHTYYQDDGTTTCHDGKRVYYLGLEHSGASCGGTYDPVVVSTFLRAVNWTSATTTNSGITLDGFTTADLVPSYYLTSKPAFFGKLAWPPIDPANPAYSMSRTNIPAGYRLVFGVDPTGGGPVNQAPVVIATATPKTGAAPLAVAFSSAGSVDPEGTSLTCIWTFGDGTTSTAVSPSHTYPTVGSYTAFVTVSDGTNTVSSTNFSITVTVAGLNQPPIAQATAPSTSGATPLSVAFSSAGSADPEGTPLTYNWVFGDGATSTAANPTHSYSVSGMYTAQLTVSDGTNTSSPATLAITVGNGATGLVATYGFEETSGSLVTDTSGNGNNGTISGATRTAGRFGSGLSFNGTSALVNVNDSASLDMVSRMTLEAWVYPTGNSGWKDIVFKNTDIYFLMGSTPTAQAPGFGGSFASVNAYGAAPLPVNTWTHLAGTYDGTTMRLYVNGVQVASRAQTGAMATSSGQLSIGGDSINNQFWAGLIDEVRIYNRALSAAEILADMNTPVVGTSTAPNPPNGLRIMLSP